MYSESDIDGAVAAGAISSDAAAALRRHVATVHAAPAVDEESYRATPRVPPSTVTRKGSGAPAAASTGCAAASRRQRARMSRSGTALSDMTGSSSMVLNGRLSRTCRWGALRCGDGARRARSIRGGTR